MKTLFLFFLLSLASTFCLCQDSTGNFYSKNGSVFWQHTYSWQGTFSALLSAVKRAGILTNIDTFENTIVGQSIEAPIDYKGAGYTTMNTPMIIMGTTYKSSVLIDYADTSYTVTVRKILFVNQTDTKLISPVLGSAQGEITPFEEYSIKKDGKFKDSFFKKTAVPKIIEYNFNKIYSL